MENVILKQLFELNVPLFCFITNFSAHLKIHHSHPIALKDFQDLKLTRQTANCLIFCAYEQLIRFQAESF